MTLKMIMHIQFIGMIRIEVRLGWQFSTLFGIVLDVLIEEDGLRRILMRIHAGLIANPVQIRCDLGKGSRIAAIAAIDAAKRSDADQDTFLGVTTLQHQWTTRVAVASGTRVATAGADVGAAKRERKITLAAAIVDDLELHVAQHVADRMHARRIASPARGDAQFVLEAAVLVVPLGQLYGMYALCKREGSNELLILAGYASP